MITPTISTIEVIYTLFALIGFIFCSRTLGRALGDLFVLRYSKINSVREYSAITTVIAKGTWCGIQLGLVVIGIIAMTKSNSNGPWTSLILDIIFVCFSGVCSLGAFTVDKRRRELIDMIRETEILPPIVKETQLNN